MSNRTLAVTDRIYEYLLATTVREPRVLAELREETQRIPMARMQIAPEQGQLMGLLVELIGARRALEIGVFTGYSAIAVALALPADGLLVACDVNEEWTKLAQQYFARAGVAGAVCWSWISFCNVSWTGITPNWMNKDWRNLSVCWPCRTMTCGS